MSHIYTSLIPLRSVSALTKSNPKACNSYPASAGRLRIDNLAALRVRHQCQWLRMCGPDVCAVVQRRLEQGRLHGIACVESGRKREVARIVLGVDYEVPVMRRGRVDSD